MAKRELTKDELKVKESINAMTKWQRACYYFSIYKFYGLAVIIVLGMIISIIHSVLTAKTDVLYLGIINKSTYCSAYMVDSYAEYAGIDPKKEEVALFDGLGTSQEYYAGGYNLITMYTAADELNLVFTDKEAFDFLGITGIVATPERWMAPEVYEYFKDRIIEMPVIEDTTDMSENPKMIMQPVVIDLQGTRIQEAFGLDDDTRYLICVIHKGFEEQLEKYSRYLYDIEKGVQPLNYTPPVKNGDRLDIELPFIP